MKKIARLAASLLTPFLLASCLLTPGKFTSTLTLNADRTFAFTYLGEVIAVAPSSAMVMADNASGGSASPAAADDPEIKNREIAAALSREAGYKSVVYKGKGKFAIDYAIAGRLDHGFVFPFNVDAEAVFPFLAVELRKDGLVRVKAPGFANSSSNTGMPAMPGSGASIDAAKFLDGSFTLDTDAEIVSQNNEGGSVATGARRRIAWRISPLTRDAPTAVVRLRP